MIALHQIQIQTPCHENWDAMSGGNEARFCAQCKKTVHDLSQMTASDAQILLTQSGASVCVRLTRMEDGKIKTLDTPASSIIKKRFHKPKHFVKPTTVKPRTPVPNMTTGMIAPVSPPPVPPTQQMGGLSATPQSRAVVGAIKLSQPSK